MPYARPGRRTVADLQLSRNCPCLCDELSNAAPMIAPPTVICLNSGTTLRFGLIAQKQDACSPWVFGGRISGFGSGFSRVGGGFQALTLARGREVGLRQLVSSWRRAAPRLRAPWSGPRGTPRLAHGAAHHKMQMIARGRSDGCGNWGSVAGTTCGQCSLVDAKHVSEARDVELGCGGRLVRVWREAKLRNGSRDSTEGCVVWEGRGRGCDEGGYCRASCCRPCFPCPVQPLHKALPQCAVC